MWFAKPKRRRKRRKGSKSASKSPLLMVKATSSGARKMRTHQMAVLVLVPLIIAIVGGLVWLSFRGLYSTNDRYTIRELEITTHGDGVVTAAKVRAFAGIDKGTNLFAFSVGRIRSELLSDVPNIEEVVIRRILPASLFIDVYERRPVARIDRTRNFIDAHGHVFYKSLHRGTVPVIRGIRQSLTPGDVVDESVMNALTVIATCDRSPERYGSDLKLASIDVRDPDYLKLSLAPNGPVASVDLDWDQRGLQTEAARVNLLGKLDRLVGVVRKAKKDGRQHSNINLRHPETITASGPST